MNAKQERVCHHCKEQDWEWVGATCNVCKFWSCGACASVWIQKLANGTIAWMDTCKQCKVEGYHEYPCNADCQLCRDFEKTTTTQNKSFCVNGE